MPVFYDYLSSTEYPSTFCKVFAFSSLLIKKHGVEKALLVIKTEDKYGNINSTGCMTINIRPKARYRNTLVHKVISHVTMYFMVFHRCTFDRESYLRSRPLRI